MDVRPLTAPLDVGAAELHAVAETLVNTGTRQKLTVATAESLTAGLAAATIADVPGASAVLRGGLIVYATALKGTLAGVDEDVLRTAGAVSAQTAEQLACGAAERCGATIGIGLTGAAGPDTQEGKAAGTVFVASWTGGIAQVYALHAAGDRAHIRRAAVWAGLHAAIAAMDTAADAAREQNHRLQR